MSNVERAKEEKDKGNEAYKRRCFDEAEQHYKNAIQLDPSDMT
jgi:hypothetical protein